MPATLTGHSDPKMALLLRSSNRWTKFLDRPLRSLEVRPLGAVPLNQHKVVRQASARLKYVPGNLLQLIGQIDIWVKPYGRPLLKDA